MQEAKSILPTRELNTHCRRCGECRESEHHWIDANSPLFDYRCKHCDAVASDCPDCCGSGQEDMHADGTPCETCGGPGMFFEGWFLPADEDA